MSCELFRIAPDSFEKFAKNYNRTLESLDEDVETIKRWLKTQPHLPELMVDIAIRNFLVLNKCSVEKAKQRIDMYYTIRSLLPEIYEPINPRNREMLEILKNIYCVPLPKTTPEGYRVFMFKIRQLPKNQKISSFYGLQVGINLQEIRLFEDCIQGDVGVIDFAGLSLDNINILTPTTAAKMAATYQKVYSTPLKALYAINAPSFVSSMLIVAKMIFKPKIIDRIKITSDAAILHKVFPKEMIPRDYGGEEKSLEELKDMVTSKLTEYQWRFDALDRLRTDENLRPEKLDNDHFLGFHGNFKKIEVD